MNSPFPTPEILDEKDLKYLLDKPEPGFSPEKNQAAINRVIASGMKVSLDMKKAQKKDMEHRIDALSTYGCYIMNGGEKSFKKYMGKWEMAQIYGEKIMEKVRVMDSIEKLNRARGNTKYLNYFLT